MEYGAIIQCVSALLHQIINKDIRKAQSINKELQWNFEWLPDELGKTVYLAQANLRMITDKFREKTKAEIEVTTAMALQSWSEQAAELLVLCADKANQELRGPGFWKLDKANCEAVQTNLTTDFMRIALTYREEIMKLLDRHEENVQAIQAEMEIVAEPVILAAPEMEAPKEEANMEEDDSTETSILNVLNED
jgi:hypothetical protein